MIDNIFKLSCSVCVICFGLAILFVKPDTYQAIDFYVRSLSDRELEIQLERITENLQFRLSEVEYHLNKESDFFNKRSLRIMEAISSANYSNKEYNY